MKNLILLIFVFNYFSISIIAQEADGKKSKSCNLMKDSFSDSSLKIKETDLPKYKNAYYYILSDSINQGRDVFTSDIIIDMDRFYFKSDVKNDSTLIQTIDSLTRYAWFDDFSSPEIKELFGVQNKNAESILFFSLIEKNTLRADLFVKRHNVNDFKYDWIINSNRDKVYAYFFFFDEIGEIKHAYRHEIIYGI